MLNISERLSTLTAMKTLGFDAALTQSYSEKQLREGCSAVESQQFLPQQIHSLSHVQQAMMTQPAFPAYYRALLNLGVSSAFVEEWLHESEESKCFLLDYTPEEILRVSLFPNLRVRARQEYLLYYAPMHLNPEQTELLLRNINYFYTGCYITLSELTETQRLLLLQPFLCDSLFSHELEDILPLLDQHPTLVRLLNMLYSDKVQHVFSKAELLRLRELRDADVDLLEQIHCMLGNNPGRTAHLLHLWLSNQAPLSDLMMLQKKLPKLTDEAIEAMLASRLAYLNTLHAGALGDIPFDEVPDYMLPLLVYAIDKRQNSFLRLFTEQYEEILRLDSRCMLFEKSFYTRIILNTLTAQNLRHLTNPKRQRLMLDELNDRIYTFAELNLLAYAPKHYLHLCNLLSALRTDERLIVLRQLLKRDAVSAEISDAQLHELAARLCIQPLSSWISTAFAHMPEITYPQCAAFLSVYSAVGKFLLQMQTADEAVFAARNAAALTAYDSWQYVQTHLGDIDAKWQELSQALELDDAFIKQYATTIFRFLSRNGAAIAMEYLTSQKKPEGFYRIIRAELMGQLPRLKYHQDDLNRELEFPISRKQQLLWAECQSSVCGRFTIDEKDDFFTTMRIGEVPLCTCLNYRDGVYRECLLACFDSNKKFLYATLNGKPVARAMLRLTKGRANASAEKNPSLEFADLRQPDSESPAPKGGESLVLFLEHPYTSGLNEEYAHQVREIFVRLAVQKATQLNALPVLSASYIAECSDKGFSAMNYALYISRSKAGTQYLDSLGGANGTSSEGSYRNSRLLLPVK